MGFDERNKHQEQRFFQRRIWIIALFVLVCFSVLFTRFVWLQVFHYDVFSKRADIGRIDISPIPPVRGAIVDRNGVVLAYNASTYTIEIVPSKVQGALDAVIEELGTIVPITERDVRRFRQGMNNARRRYHRIPLRWGLTQDEVARLSAQLYRFPGVEINSRFIRKYPMHETGGHVMGYLGRITEADRDALAESNELGNYGGTQYIGRVGVEASYEGVLHGTAGVAETEVTARGRPVRRLRELAPMAGNIVQLTLDVRLQRLVEKLYGNRRGAFVAIDPRSGEVLALVSMPSFDPNMFIEGFDRESWSALNDAVDQPLFHRAIGGSYPIGSTYKPFMALAGMQTGTRKADEVVKDPGFFALGGVQWRSTGGLYNATMAIIKSNNFYFYSLADAMGVNKIHDFMKPWGFGQLTGIDLGGEVKGILPSTQWKLDAFREPANQRWFDGETVNVGIGQGHNRFTMIQLATAVAALANNGMKYRPHLLLNTKDIATGDISPYVGDGGQRMEVDARYLQVVQRAMTEVPKQGTSRGVFADALYNSGGKTGTAQVASLRNRSFCNYGVLDQCDHSLYIAFAPAEDPQIAIAVIVENGGNGARSAAPIARRAMDYYLLGIYPSEVDIKRVQQGYAGVPVGQSRSVQSYDILESEALIPLSVIEFDASQREAGSLSAEPADGGAENVQGDTQGGEVQNFVPDSTLPVMPVVSTGGQL